MPRISKKFALLLVLAMLASMFIGMGTASASTQVYCPSTATVTDGGAAAIGNLFVQIDPGILAKTYEQVEIDLPSDIQLVNDGNLTYTSGGTYTANTDYKIATANVSTIPICIVAPTAVGQDTNAVAASDIYTAGAKALTFGEHKIVLTLNATGANYPVDSAYLRIYFNKVYIKSGFSGDINATLTSPDNFPGGTVLLGTCGSGTTSIAVASVKTINEDTGTTDDITLQESVGGALNAEKNVMTLTLPSGISWNTPTFTADWGFSGYTVVNTAPPATMAANTIYWYVSNDRELKISLGTKSASKGRIKLTNIDLGVDASTAKEGDVAVSVDGASPDSLVVATYGTYGATVKEGTPANMLAGRFDQKTGDFTIVESAAGSLVKDHTVTLTLPDFAKWPTILDANSKIQLDTTKVKLETTAGTDVIGTASLEDQDAHILKFKITDTTTDAATIKLKNTTQIMLAANATGDVNVEVGGSAGVTGTAKIGTVTSPVALAVSAPTTVVIGRMNQAVGDLTLTEAQVKALMEYNYNSSDDTGMLYLDLPAGVTFATVPTVTSTGGMDIEDVARDTSAAGTVNGRLKMKIKSESTSAGTISITKILLTVDRTVPEGDILVKAKGPAVTLTTSDSTKDSVYTNGEWASYTTVAQATIATVGTPAPVDQTNSGSFVIGSTSYTANGVTKTMDVAPYIKDGRTYMPIAYVADALGITSSNVLWDATSQTVTLMKGDKVVQLKIGSTTMLVNGAAITLDAAPEISSSRTCLPIALVAQAFGATATWDAATSTVTIK